MKARPRTTNTSPLFILVAMIAVLAALYFAKQILFAQIFWRLTVQDDRQPLSFDSSQRLLVNQLLFLLFFL